MLKACGAIGLPEIGSRTDRVRKSLDTDLSMQSARGGGMVLALLSEIEF
jgi:hypothetical protein